VKSKLTIIGLFCVTLVVALAALSYYSYRRLLEFEHMFMPEFTTLSTNHERRVLFHVFDLWEGTLLPHWTVTYHEEPVTDTEYIDPSITVDLFGRILDGSSKEVSWAVETYKGQNQ